MSYRADTPQPLRLPDNMIIKVEKICKSLSVSKNDVYKMAIALLIRKMGETLDE